MTVIKGRTAAQIKEAVEAGAVILGTNYLQEARDLHAVAGPGIKWHFIGHLQKNKVKAAVAICNMIETLDSLELAVEINKRCGEQGKKMPVLIEVNSGREANKTGVMPEEVYWLAQQIAGLAHIELQGLMTMGPLQTDATQLLPYFTLTKKLFDELTEMNLPGVKMKYLSMGMSDSYPAALAAGANLVRIGRAIFA